MNYKKQTSSFGVPTFVSWLRVHVSGCCKGLQQKKKEGDLARLHTDSVLNSFTAFSCCCERMEQKDVITCVVASDQLLACSFSSLFPSCFMMAGSLCTK